MTADSRIRATIPGIAVGPLTPSSPWNVRTISSWMRSTSSASIQCATPRPFLGGGSTIGGSGNAYGRAATSSNRISLPSISRTGLHDIFASSIIRPKTVGRPGPVKRGPSPELRRPADRVAGTTIGRLLR